MIEMLEWDRSVVDEEDEDSNSALHLAVMEGNDNVVKLLIKEAARLDSRNKDGRTPFLVAVQSGHTNIARELIEVDKGVVEDQDDESNTALHLAAMDGNDELVRVLVRERTILTTRNIYGLTAFLVAAKSGKISTVRELIRLNKGVIGDKDDNSNTAIHLAAMDGNNELIKALVKAGASIRSKNKDAQTPLHLAAMKGHKNTVLELMKLDKNVVNDADDESNTPLHLAAMKGNHELIQLLVKKGARRDSKNIVERTPIHLAASNGHLSTVKELVRLDPEVVLNADMDSNTALHLAAGKGNEELITVLLDRGSDVNNRDVALLIVNSPCWKEALRNATKDPLTGYVETPLRKLIRTMPDVAERVFDRCLSEGVLKDPKLENYEVIFDYEFLDDIYTPWVQDGAGCERHYSFTEQSSYTKSYTTDLYALKENHPMSIMVSSRRRKLLAHPLVTSLLTHKLNSFVWFFYFSTLFIYCIFLAFLTVYMVSSDPPHAYDSTIRSLIEDDDCDGVDRTRGLFCTIGTYVIIAYAALSILKEIAQLYKTKLGYLNGTNMVELLVYILSILLVTSFNGCQRKTGYRYNWQWNVGTTAMFLAWVDLVLIIQRVPIFGIYVVMFFDVLKTFSRLFVVFFFFIVGFALALYCLFQNMTPFSSVGKSLVKAFVMMIGEFEFDSIFHSDTDPLEYPPASYILWMIFLLTVSIVVMNLLVGLAVNDIQAVQQQAVIKRLAMQVELVLNMERVIPPFLRRKLSVTRKMEKTIKPNLKSKNPIRKFIHSSYAISPETLQKVLHSKEDEIKKTEAEKKMQVEVEKIQMTLKSIQDLLESVVKR